MSEEIMLRIGNKKEGINYKKRICAYAIIERSKDKKIAIATDKPDIYFLLGGGHEKDELIEETLKNAFPFLRVSFCVKNIKNMLTDGVQL